MRSFVAPDFCARYRCSTQRTVTARHTATMIECPSCSSSPKPPFRGTEPRSNLASAKSLHNRSVRSITCLHAPWRTSQRDFNATLLYSRFSLDLVVADRCGNTLRYTANSEFIHTSSPVRLPAYHRPLRDTQPISQIVMPWQQYQIQFSILYIVTNALEKTYGIRKNLLTDRLFDDIMYL